MKHRDLIDAITKAGFVLERTGKHDIYVKGDIEVQIPHHKEVNEITARSIMKKAGVI